MIGKVEIVNLALSRLNEGPIQSLDEGSKPANLAKIHYDPARRSTLRAYNWNFALKTMRLARLEEAPVDFHFAFSLPSDCLRAVRLLREGVPDFMEKRKLRFVTRSNRLLTDAASAVLEYVEDVTDPARFDDVFVEALSYKLASEMAKMIVNSSELMNAYSNAYRTLIEEAATLSAREEEASLPENPYLDARYGNG